MKTSKSLVINELSAIYAERGESMATVSDKSFVCVYSADNTVLTTLLVSTASEAGVPFTLKGDKNGRLTFKI